MEYGLGIAIFPRGPKGHGTQGLGAGMGITRLEHQAAVWAGRTSIASKENGVTQLFGGAGGPAHPRGVGAGRLLAVRPPRPPRGGGAVERGRVGDGA